jgi:hypothetical protein
MSKKPTHADAHVILELYNLRREPEMRKARAWWLGEFWPNSVEDFTKVSAAMGTQENNWMRQVSGYWEMAASLAVHGAVSSDLFLEPSFSGEMFFLFAKVNPFLKELREKISPTMLRNVEQLIKSTKFSREFFKRTEASVAARRKAMVK